jgi:HEAT repeat protein
MSRIVLGVLVCGLAAAAARGQAVTFLNRPLDAWEKDLSHKDAAVRRSAAFAVGRLGSGGLQAVPYLLRRLKVDDDAGVRATAASAVGDVVAALRSSGRVLGPDVAGLLQKALDEDADPRVKRGAAYALGTFGTAAAPAAESLRKALRDREPSVRQNAAWALGQLGADAAGDGAVGGLCELLEDRDDLVRRDAAGALEAVAAEAPASAVGPLLALVARERDGVVLKTALNTLIALAGPDQRDAPSGALERLLGDRDPETRQKAAFVLAKLGGPGAGKAVAVLREALKDDDPAVQELAVTSLSNLGPAAAPAVLDLARALAESRSAVIRRNAAIALGKMGAGAKPALPVLTKALGPDEPVEVRQHAAEAFAQIGLPHTESALPAIFATLKKDPDPLVRQRCVWALFKFRELGVGGARRLMEEARPVLSEVLEEKGNEHLLVRYDAARMLANALGEDAPARTVDILLEMLGNKTLRVFQGTDTRVAGGGNEAGGGKTDLAANLGGDARYMAAEALSWVGKKASGRADVVEALKKAVTDPDEKLRKMAKEALRELGVK